MTIEGLLRAHGHDMRRTVRPDGALVYVQRGRVRGLLARIARAARLKR